MKFKRLFFDNYIKLESISKRNLVFCIVIGLLSSFAIYSAFYVLRETFRLMSFGYEFAPHVFSEKGRWLSNWFFAYLSLIFGNSVVISFLFRRPQKNLSRRNKKRERILNEQVFLNLNFMYWFGKIGLTFGVMSVSMLDFQFFPEYYIPFILLILVMYMETWKTLLRVIKRRKHLYMFFHFIILSCLAFGLSKIDIVDYERLDKSILDKNPIINLPESFYHNSEQNYRRFNPIVHFKLLTDENDSLVIVYEGYKKVGLIDIQGLMLAEKSRLPEELMYRMSVSISANKKVKLKHLKAFEAEIYSTGQTRVRYDVIDREIKPNRFTTYGLNKRLSKLVLKHKVDFGIPLPPPLPGLGYLEYQTFSDTINVSVSEDIKFDNVRINEAELVKSFEKRIDTASLFLYNLNIEISYQNYITVVSAHNRAVYNLRQKNATSGFDISKERYDFSESEKKELNRLKEQFPIYFKEVSE